MFDVLFLGGGGGRKEDFPKAKMPPTINLLANKQILLTLYLSVCTSPIVFTRCVIIIGERGKGFTPVALDR